MVKQRVRIRSFIRIKTRWPMSDIDYACGIDCPESHNDEEMLMDFVINNDCELCYLDTYLKESFAGAGPGSREAGGALRTPVNVMG